MRSDANHAGEGLKPPLGCVYTIVPSSDENAVQVIFIPGITLTQIPQSCFPPQIYQIMEEAVPETSSSYHYLSFGFILDGLVRSVYPDGGLREYVRDRIGSKLEFGEEFGIGVERAGGVSCPKKAIKFARVLTT